MRGHLRPGAVRWLAAVSLFFAVAGANAASLTVYDGSLENSFADYGSWAASYSFASTGTVRGTETKSIAFKPDNWGGVRVLAANGTVRYPIPGYGSLTFWVNGGSGSGQKINVAVELIEPSTGQTADYGAIDIGSQTAAGQITSNTWQQVTIDFDKLKLTYGALNAVVLQAARRRFAAAGLPHRHHVQRAHERDRDGRAGQRRRRYAYGRPAAQSADLRRGLWRRHAQRPGRL